MDSRSEQPGAKLGESEAVEQLRSHIIPSILYGLEMGKVKNATLDGWHARCLSEVMRIWRYTREEGYAGGEVNPTCVWANYSQQPWSKNRAQNAKSLPRSINSMEDSALPKKSQLAGNRRTNLLTTQYTPKVVKEDDSEDSWRDELKNTLSGMNAAKERTQWKMDEKCSRATAQLDKRVAIQTGLSRAGHSSLAQCTNRGGETLSSGSAYGQSLQSTGA